MKEECNRLLHCLTGAPVAALHELYAFESIQMQLLNVQYEVEASQAVSDKQISAKGQARKTLHARDVIHADKKAHPTF